ncbi:DUF305 domain-containing protein [Microbacterium sp. NPDC086615]|uniref:DUF305 domain-containing protein n=1 Tax=Microbacterium sp. NPDC086615 TaxID=3154865 RepID=UPI00343548BF
MRIRSASMAGATLALLLAIAGCAGTGSSMSGMDHGDHSAPPASSDRNDADVMFASMMIPHHAQAVEMSDTLLAKDGIDERVTALAEDIKAAQQPEIDKMQGWLEGWGVDASNAGSMHHGDGMMNADDITALEKASGDEAERLFLSQMIQHHRGAVDMAQEEIEAGSNTAAVSLARSIVETQMTEIATMEQLQAKLS